MKYEWLYDLIWLSMEKATSRKINDQQSEYRLFLSKRCDPCQESCFLFGHDSILPRTASWRTSGIILNVRRISISPLWSCCELFERWNGVVMGGSSFRLEQRFQVWNIPVPGIEEIPKNRFNSRVCLKMFEVLLRIYVYLILFHPHLISPVPTGISRSFANDVRAVNLFAGSEDLWGLVLNLWDLDV